ncbi:MAG: HAD-IC family P-type ATPase [bacterium]
MESNVKGLTTVEANELLKKYGENIVKTNEISPLRMFINQFFKPLIGLLVLAAVISVITDSINDAIVISIIILINGLLGFIQEYKSRTIVDKLKSLICSDVLVLRDGKEVSIPKSKLVKGDVIFLKLGDIVPADAEILEENELLVDEASISGESNLVAEKKNIYSGTVIKKGTLTARVYATGKDSKFGQIADLSLNTKKPSEYEQNLSRITNFTIILLAVFATILFFVHIATKPNSDIASILLFVVAISITIVPESLPLITSLTLTNAANKMSKKSVVVKRPTSIEDLGNIDIICTDKTGTLTKNQMKVEKYITDDEEKLLKYSYLSVVNTKDPFDVSISEFIKTKNIPNDTNSNNEEVKLDEYKDFAFDPETKVSSREYKDFIVIKGAPEAIFEMSKYVQSEIHTKEINGYQAEGLRAISVALKDKKTESCNYLGTFLLEDEIKEGIEEVVKKIISHNLKVKIITGDSAITSGYVGKKIGLIKDESKVIDASLLHFDNSETLVGEVENYTIFARANPTQKYKIIEALEKNHFVGYLGDGINDTPALKLANVGIVVNNASDIAKSIADMIILEKSISVIVDGVIEGRKTFENIDKYIRYTLVGNFGNFFSIGILSLLLPFFPLLPIHILVNNLLVDIASLSFAFDHVSSIDTRKPKHHDLRNTIKYSLILAVISSLSDFIFFAFLKETSTITIQSMWFIFTTLSEILIIYSLRTNRLFINRDRPSKFLVITVTSCIIITLAIAIFGFPIGDILSINMDQFIYISVFVVGFFVVCEVIKLLVSGKYREIKKKAHI